MPEMPCTKGGKPGFKWGPNGTCYTYTRGNKASKARAHRKAGAQGAAIKHRGGK